MANRKKKTKQELAAEREIRALSAAIEREGIVVRREKLSRGASFKVKSGGCIYTGAEHVFVDRRLPLDRQLAILLDSLLELTASFYKTELQHLSKQTVNILESRFGEISVIEGDKPLVEKSSPDEEHEELSIASEVVSPESQPAV